MFIAVQSWLVYELVARFHIVPDDALMSFADGDDLDLTIFLD